MRSTFSRRWTKSSLLSFSDYTGVEYFDETDKRWKFRFTEERYGLFSGNQQADAGLHIAVLNRWPADIIAHPDATKAKEGYAAPDRAKIKAMIAAVEEFESHGGSVDAGLPLIQEVLHDHATGKLVGQVLYYVDGDKKIPVQFSADFDLKSIKQVQGQERNDWASQGTNYIALGVPDFCKRNYIDELRRYVGLDIDDSQELHISLAIAAPSWMPAPKSPKNLAAWKGEASGKMQAAHRTAFSIFRGDGGWLHLPDGLLHLTHYGWSGRTRRIN